MLPDAVVGQQGFVLVHTLGETLREIVDEIQQGTLAVLVHLGDGFGVLDLAGLVLRHAVRQVTVNTTGAEIRGMHAGARHGFIHVKQVFTLAEGVDQDGRAAAVVAVRTEPHEVIQDAGDFREHHADVLCAHRHFQTQHLFDGQAVSVLVAHHRHIVQAVHVGQRLDVGLVFGQLFGGAVQQTDVRVGALHHLAVEFQHQTQHTVRSRVLWTKVQGVVFDFGHISSGLRSVLHG